MPSRWPSIEAVAFTYHCPKRLQHCKQAATQRTTGKRTAQLQHNVLPAVHAHGARHAPRLARRGEPAAPARRQLRGRLRGTPAPTSPPARATVKSSRRKSGSFDDDDDDESGRRLDLALLPRASRRNLQRQKRARVVEMHASGKQTTLFLRMRELQQLVRDAVPKARQPSQTDLHKRKAHNALHPRDLRAVDATNPHACKNRLLLSDNM